MRVSWPTENRTKSSKGGKYEGICSIIHGLSILSHDEFNDPCDGNSGACGGGIQLFSPPAQEIIAKGIHMLTILFFLLLLILSWLTFIFGIVLKNSPMITMGALTMLFSFWQMDVAAKKWLDRDDDLFW
jgi:hypothetical protein